MPRIANGGKRHALGLSIGATILFLVFTLYWNRLLARLVFWLLRLKAWGADNNGSVWFNAGMRDFRPPEIALTLPCRVGSGITPRREDYDTRLQISIRESEY